MEGVKLYANDVQWRGHIVITLRGNSYHGTPLSAYSIPKSASGYQSKTDLIYRLTENQDRVFYETTGERTQWKGKVLNLPLT